MIRLPAFGLRLKLVLLSSFLFTIPWLGWEYVWEMEKYLRQGQERSLAATARAIASALHDRPLLFERNASFLSSVSRGRDLYAYQIAEPILLDGRLNDWSAYVQHQLNYAGDYVIEGQEIYRPESLSFNHMVGKFDQYLYAYFEVTDNVLILRGENSRRIDRNDYLEIAFLSPDALFRRYVVTATQPGWFTAYRLTDDPDSFTPVQPEPAILGRWVETAAGYNIELRIPLAMIGSKIGFAINDVDDPHTRTKLATVGTSNTRTLDGLGTVLVPSPEIEKIISGMRHSSSRIRVVDKHQRVLASTGDIRDSDGPWAVQPVRKVAGDGVFTGFLSKAIEAIEKHLFFPIYEKLLNRPSNDFIDELENTLLFEGTELSPVLSSALAGKPSSQWRLTSDRAAVILSTAHPIYIDEQVMGGVIAEETTNGIRTLRNRALEKLFSVIVTVMVLGTLALFVFASRVSSRIRKLRNEAEQAIDEQGRVTSNLGASKNRDEIGDLSRSLSNMVGRLGSYTSYLENMSSRLSHELRTPVTIVKSSLENMSMLPLDDNAQVYMERAQHGIDRLTGILSNMSEATRIEQALQTSEWSEFDLSKIVGACGEAYNQVYPEQQFVFDIWDGPLIVAGVPEHLAQLLDKLVANAVEFSERDTPIRLNLRIERFHGLNYALIEVINRGPCLPEQMQDRLFDPMVSVRTPQAGEDPHLGIGLYIARLITEFHRGEIEARNLPLRDGVIVSARFPLKS